MKNVRSTYFFLFAALLLILASLPFFHSTFFVIHDYTHVARIAEMARSLQAGEFPVQWSQNFGSGYGMPLFLFYGPLPFFIGGLFFLLGIPGVESMKLVFLLSNVFAFAGMYHLMKRWGRTAGLIAANAFLWAPYRALDIYVRGALSEVVALSLLPWILHWSFAQAEKRRFAWFGVAASIAAVILSHNLTALIALPLLFAVSVVFIALRQRRIWKNLLLLATSYATGVALSAFYVLPLFAEKSFTIVDEITGGYFDFRLHFVFLRQFFTASWGYTGSTYGPEDGISFHLGRVVLLMALVVTFFALGKLFQKVCLQKTSLSNFIKQEKKSLLILTTAFALALSLFLTLGRSAFVWKSIPFLAYIQFPWRYLTIATVFLSMLAGFWVSTLRSFFWRWTAVLLAVFGIVATQFSYHQPAGYLDTNNELYSSDAEHIRTTSSEVLFDYLPKTFDRELPPVAPEERISLQGVSAQNLNWERNTPTQLLVTTEASEGATIRWNIADFPGWQYSVNGQIVTPRVNERGLAEYQATEPVTQVAASFTATPVRQLGNLISFTAVLLSAGILIWQHRKGTHD